MKKIVRCVLPVILAAVMAAPVFAGGRGSGTGTAGGKKKVTAAIMTFESLDPFKASGHVIIQIGKALYNPLFCEYGGEVKGVMAREWKWADDFNLDVTIYDYIHDAAGNPITADDVVFSYQTWTSSSGGAMFGSKLKNIVKTGEYSVRLTFTEKAYPSFMDNVGCFIVSKKAYEASRNGFNAQPVSTGAYKVTAVTSGVTVTMEKYDTYWQKDSSLLPEPYKPRVDVVQYDVINEPSQIQTALELGNIQCGEITAPIAEDFAGNKNLAVKKVNQKYSGMLMFNMFSGPFKDNLALRQAVCYAIDVPALARAVTFGQGRKSFTFGDDSQFGYVKKWDSEDYYNTNLDKAKELLAQAGYRPGQLKLRYLAATGEVNSLQAQILQGDLKKIGIDVEISLVDNTAYIMGRTADSGLWDLCPNGLVPKGYWVSGMKMVVDTTIYTMGNMMGFKDDQLQNLLETALYSPNDRNNDALWQYVKQNAYGFGLQIDYVYYGVHPGIQTMVFSCDGEIAPQAFVLGPEYNVYAK
jgi:ABC-type transport system substrate-binding protein